MIKLFQTLFESNTLKMFDNLSMLGVKIYFKKALISDSLLSSNNFLLSTFYVLIRPDFENDSHLCREASNNSLSTIDVIQKRAINLIKQPDP